MLSQKVCNHCWKEQFRIDDFDLNSQFFEKAKEWNCILIRWVKKEDDPPEDCPRVLEHAVAAGMKNA